MRRKNKYKGKIFASGYSQHGASSQKSSMSEWQTSSASPTQDQVENMPKLRERSRDSYYGAPLGRAAVDRVVSNVVGSGMKMKSSISAEFLGLSEDEKNAWEDTVEREFGYWAESKNCDLTKKSTFYEMQKLVFLSVLMNGDAFVLLPFRKSPDFLYDLRVMLLEGDRVQDPAMKPPGRTIVGGIETDSDGAPAAYYISNRHPDDTSSTVQLKYERVEAFGKKTGRRNVLHLMQGERVDQARGIPFLSPALETLKQLTRYTDAELMAAVISGMFAVLFEHDKAELELGEEDQATDEDVEGKVEPVAAGISEFRMGYGVVGDLPPGVKPSTVAPNRPNQSFEGFVLAMCRQVGASLGIPYEVLILHFTSSYSASRGALLEAWKLFKNWREWLVINYCQPIFEEWLTEAVLTGRISAPGFIEDPMRRYCFTWAEWYGPTQGQLDPLKEAKAAGERIDRNISTETREAMELTGSEWDSNIRIRAREEKMKKELGIGQPEISKTGGEEDVGQGEGERE